MIRANHNGFLILPHPAVTLKFFLRALVPSWARQPQLLGGEDDMKEERSPAPKRAPFFLFPEQISDSHDALASSGVGTTRPGGCSQNEPFLSHSACVGWGGTHGSEEKMTEKSSLSLRLVSPGFVFSWEEKKKKEQRNHHLRGSADLRAKLPNKNSRSSPEKTWETDEEH